jgi:hypothetical protein
MEKIQIDTNSQDEVCDYTVNVVVTSLDGNSEIAGEVPRLYIKVQPEVLRLNGQNGNKITWSLSGDVNAGGVTGPFFRLPGDVQFMTDRGTARFSNVVVDPHVGRAKAITTTVDGEETDQTIYTYLLTVRFMVGEQEIAISIDPEVDNPPPVPRP